MISIPADTLPQVRAIVTALQQAGLTTHLSDSSGSVAAPFVVVHPSPGTPSGSLGDRFQDLTVDFQTTSVGETAEQALSVHDDTMRALFGATPPVAGRIAHPVWLSESPQTVRRDDTAAAPMFYAVARWSFRTST
jgi:hypothetical protein